MWLPQVVAIGFHLVSRRREFYALAVERHGSVGGGKRSRRVCVRRRTRGCWAVDARRHNQFEGPPRCDRRPRRLFRTIGARFHDALSHLCGASVEKHQRVSVETQGRQGYASAQTRGIGAIVRRAWQLHVDRFQNNDWVACVDAERPPHPSSRRCCFATCWYAGLCFVQYLPLPPAARCPLRVPDPNRSHGTWHLPAKRSTPPGPAPAADVGAVKAYTSPESRDSTTAAHQHRRRSRLRPSRAQPQPPLTAAVFV